jgi:hypothetical protein
MTQFINIDRILAILSLILAYIFYRKSLKLKEPCWSMASQVLIQDKISKLDNLEILYNHVKVENITVSRILFWNRGSEAIRGEDLNTDNPLRIQGDRDTKLLSVEIVDKDHDKIFLKYNETEEKENDKYLLNFSYLDKNQGAVIEVIHNGKSARSISFCGRIIGGEVKRVDKGKTIYDSIPNIIGILSFISIFPLMIYVPENIGFYVWFSSFIALMAIRMLLEYYAIFTPFPKKFRDFDRGNLLDRYHPKMPVENIDTP